MDERLKYFFYGLIVGGKQVERVKVPIETPVEIINIGYDRDTMYVDERQILTASIFPVLASYKEVEWSSSNISVISINKLTPTTAEVLAVDTGDVIITCKATDGSGVTATLNMHAIANKVYTEFSFSYESRGLGSLRTPDELIEVNYQPADMPADKWGIKLNPIKTGAETPYQIVNTPFRNIKAIKNTFKSGNYDDYFTYGTSVGYDIETYDGSGYLLSGRTLQSIASDLKESLYGVSGPIYKRTLEIKVGYTVNLYSAFGRTTIPDQCLYLNSIGLEIDNPDIIEIDSRKNVKAIASGVCNIIGTLPSGEQWTLELTCSDSITETTRPSVIVTDEKGQEITSEGRIDTGVGNKVYLAVRGNVTSGLVEITGVTNPDIAEVTSDGGVLIKSDGSVTIQYKLIYNSSSGETEYNSSTSVRIISSRLAVGRVSSSYLEEGLVLYVTTRNVLYNNGYLTNKVNPVYNANLVTLKQIMLVERQYVSSFNTLTFEPSLSTGGGTVTMYHMIKNTTEPVTIRFQLEGNPEIFEEITI